MCPSYMATKDEKDSTRARANILREMLTNSTKANPFDHKEIKEVMDLCLSCKGCKSECPSSVDMAKLKADFLQAYYDSNGVPFRSWMIGHVDNMTQIAAKIPGLYNWLIRQAWTSRVFKKVLGFAPQRQIPKVAAVSLRNWFERRERIVPEPAKGKVYFFFDEFTNFNEVEIGKKAIFLLEGLGYEVLSVAHAFSGRALLSKGFLREAKKLAERNVATFSGLVQADIPLIAVEPSTILTFRDEYVDLVEESQLEAAQYVAKHALTIEEFLVREKKAKRLGADNFSSTAKDILLHAHCQQKAWGLQATVAAALAIPAAYTVTTIASGCCGMAGSFGYEKEHYQLSQDIGNLVLFPKIRAKAKETIVAAPGSSCRHQIREGVEVEALHPVEILYQAMHAKK